MKILNRADFQTGVESRARQLWSWTAHDQAFVLRVNQLSTDGQGWSVGAGARVSWSSRKDLPWAMAHAHIAKLVDLKIQGYFLVPIVWIFDAPPGDLSMMERSCNGKTGKSTSYVLFYCLRINTETHQTDNEHLPSLIWVLKYFLHRPALKTRPFCH